MELTTISTVSKQLNITTRTLRYYEELGLIKSRKMPNYAYRAYDDETIKKIQQIVILRKLSLSLKQIKSIFESSDAKYALKVFLNRIDELDLEIDSLNAVKSVIQMLVENLKHSVDFDIELQLTENNEIEQVLNSLTLTKKGIKEKKAMEDVKKVTDAKDSLKEIRIIYLPPATVASSHYIGAEPENNAAKELDKFILDNNLPDNKPDFRVYGFNNPNPQGNEEYGYEFWVTIPDDMNVPAPLEKKQFDGGLYAAYCINMGDFHKWQTFYEWVMKSEDYDYDAREPLSMGGTLEEQLNVVTFYKSDTLDRSNTQLDLLIPIKENK